ncbi:MAG: hypothetical protein ACNA8J_08225 [Gammaproteobacteria bacterium]
MPKKLHALAIAALLAFIPVASADVLIIEKLEAAKMEMPSRGMTMDRVQNRFGAPRNITGPVGDPPITRWDYGDFVVVFEYRHVIHSIEKSERPPRPAS